MKKLNSKGFSLVEIILILVVVTLLGVVGWFVWHNKSNTPIQTTTSNSSSQPQEPVAYKRTTTVPSSWKTYNNSTYNFSLSYPSTWYFNAAPFKDANTSGEVFTVLMANSAVKGDATACNGHCLGDPQTNMSVHKQSLEKTLEDVKKLDANPPGSKLTMSNLTIDGHPAVKVDATYFSLQNSYLIYNNGYTYVFNLFKGYKTNDVLTIFESLTIK